MTNLVQTSQQWRPKSKPWTVWYTSTTGAQNFAIANTVRGPQIRKDISERRGRGRTHKRCCNPRLWGFCAKYILGVDQKSTSLKTRGTPKKALDRQVNLYHREEETSAMIVKAMTKLFTNGHVKLLKDLPQEQQYLIVYQPVQYFIPWWVVFKASSISTPARPVFDCSARTPINAEGKGGCCLNNLMAKERGMSFNLVKMLVKFSIGPAASVGTSPSYTTCSSSDQNIGTSNSSDGRKPWTPTMKSA